MSPEEVPTKVSSIEEMELNHLINAQRNIVELDMGSTSRWYARLFANGRPLLEIYYDWLTVNGYADRIKPTIVEGIRVREEDPEFEKVKGNYVTLRAYLEAAKEETDPGQAWNLVNSADKLLPLLFEDEEAAFDRSLIRLRAWDKRLFKENPQAEEIIKSVKEVHKETILPDVWDVVLPEELKRILNEMLVEIHELFRSAGEERFYNRFMPEALEDVLEKDFKTMKDILHEGMQTDVWAATVLKKLKDAFDQTVTNVKNLMAASSTKVVPSAQATQQLEKILTDTKTKVEITYKGRSTKPQAPAPGPVRARHTMTLPMAKKRAAYEYEMQAIRAQLWYSVNMKQTLRDRLWMSYAKWLLIMLVPAVVIAECLYYWDNPGKPLWYRPFLYVVVFGFAGGCLSSKLIQRNIVENNKSIHSIRILILVRMLIGAWGAFVIFVMVGCGLIKGDLTEGIADNIYALVALGIISGFTEQAFVTPLEKAASNLDIVGNTG